MKSFQCKDVMPDCDWETTGNTDDEIVEKAAQHGREKHGLKNITDEIKDKVRSSIHEVKAA
jgi:predicted small metal-binding protein